MFSRAVGPQICKDVTTRRPTQELMCMFCTLSIKDTIMQVLIRRVDTDIVVIMIRLFNELLSLHPSANAWISLGMGKHFQLVSVNAICASLGPDTSQAMPLFHSFTVCDTTSCFKGKGKKSAWEAWRRIPTQAAWAFYSGSLWQDNQWNFRNVQQEEQDPGEYATNTGKCNNPILLVFSTSNNGYENLSSLLTLSFASYFYDSIYISHPGSTNKVVCVHYRSPCYNTFWDQSTKVASGTQACVRLKWCLRPMDGAGVRSITSGNFSGPRFQKHQKTVSSFWNVAANKGVLRADLNARTLIYLALYKFMSINVLENASSLKIYGHAL